MRKIVLISITLFLLVIACASCSNYAEKTDGLQNSYSGSSISSAATAYSRKMNGTIINWNDVGCAYSIEESGGVALSYDDGAYTVNAPLSLPSGARASDTNADRFGYFISEAKTAIAYERSSGSVEVLTTTDRGLTWSSGEVAYKETPTWTNIGSAHTWMSPDMTPSWIKVGFTTVDSGWMVVCYFTAMGTEYHDIFRSEDGGITWEYIDGNINDVYSRMLSGAGFINEEVGLLCFRYETDFQPAVCITKDGGLTWSELYLELPVEYDTYSKTAFSPVYDGSDVVLPVLLSDDGNEQFIYMKSGDCGNTWEVVE